MIGDGSVAVETRAAPAGDHWGVLRALVPLYRASTCVAVGDRRRTSFWHNHWLPGGPLSSSLRILFSHTTCSKAMVCRSSGRPQRPCA